MINEIAILYFGPEGFDKDFIRSNVHLSFLFRIYLGEFAIRKFKKLSLRLIDPSMEYSNGIKMERNKIDDFIDVVQIWLDFDISSYYSAEIYERRLMVWTVIRDALLFVATQFKVSAHTILAAFSKGIEKRLECYWLTEIEAFNRQFCVNGTIMLRADEERFNFYVLITGKDNYRSEVLICSFSPVNGFETAYCIKKARWVDDVFCMLLKSGKTYIVATGLSTSHFS